MTLTEEILLSIGVLLGYGAWYYVGFFKGRLLQQKEERKAREELIQSLTTANNTNTILATRKKEYEEIIQRQNQELSEYYIALSAARTRLMQVDPNYGKSLKEVIPPKGEMN